MTNQYKILNIIIITILLVGNIFFGVKYFMIQKENNSILENQKTNDKVLAFTELFVEKVLKAETEVSFETRLQLENMVRDLNNEAILTEWQNFTQSKTELEAQTSVKNLLEILVNNIKTK
jgi:hypothetical protein